MRTLYRSTALLAFIGLSAAAMAAAPVADDRGMSSPHQPQVTPTGVAVPGCPNWSGKTLSSDGESMGTNYGCADAQNFAAMLADPSDLIHGKTGGANGVEVSVRAIRAWREAAPSSKTWQTTSTQSSKGGN